MYGHAAAIATQTFLQITYSTVAVTAAAAAATATAATAAADTIVLVVNGIPKTFLI